MTATATVGDREGSALPDPEGVARELLILWWDTHVAVLPTIAEQYRVIDHKVEVYEAILRMLRRERAETVRLAKQMTGTWPATETELARKGSTLRSQMKIAAQ